MEKPVSGMPSLCFTILGTSCLVPVLSADNVVPYSTYVAGAMHLRRKKKKTPFPEHSLVQRASSRVSMGRKKNHVNVILMNEYISSFLNTAYTTTTHVRVEVISIPKNICKFS